MRKRGLGLTKFLWALVIILAVVLAAVWYFQRYFVIQGTGVYPRNRETLDIRDREISIQDYDSLSWKLPGTQILWKVPFQERYIDSTTETITVTQLSSEDVATLACFSQLKVLDASGCTDYEALLEAWNRYPDVRVVYTVPVSGQMWQSETTGISVTSLSEEDAANLRYLPLLSYIDGTACRDYTLMYRIRSEHPEWGIEFVDSIAGTRIDPSAASLELTGAKYQELSVGLTAMPSLRTLMIHEPSATGEELLRLREEYPDVQIHWDMTVFGRVYSDDTQEMDISSQPIGSLDKAREIASHFPELTRLVLDTTGIENEDVAAYREEVRSSYKVVWTVVFTSKLSYLSDTDYFMPIKDGEWYFQQQNSYNMRYLEDCIAIDVGHSTIKTVEWAEFMPHLKYLILADTPVKDITALSYCKELIWLELSWVQTDDYTPLLGCTALEDLNISRTYGDIEPLKQMTWLKNLWWMDKNPYSVLQPLQEALPDTHIVISSDSNAVGYGWRELPHYYDMRDALGMNYMKG